jgi:hypothetical protein
VATLPASGLDPNATGMTLCETLHLTQFSGKVTWGSHLCGCLCGGVCTVDGFSTPSAGWLAILCPPGLEPVDVNVYGIQALTLLGPPVLTPIEKVITAGETTFKEVMSPHPEPKSLAVVILFFLVNVLFTGILYAWHFAPHPDHPATLKQIRQSRYG